MSFGEAYRGIKKYLDKPIGFLRRSAIEVRCRMLGQTDVNLSCPCVSEKECPLRRKRQNRGKKR